LSFSVVHHKPHGSPLQATHNKSWPGFVYTIVLHNACFWPLFYFLISWVLTVTSDGQVTQNRSSDHNCLTVA